mmetsp:Transcript_149837/g.481338  ORF Transcript_149837/g.481338 Transcript_149837/m.481338 type:complete len:290 (-) Transcript_149837:848-1717(-)
MSSSTQKMGRWERLREQVPPPNAMVDVDRWATPRAPMGVTGGCRCLHVSSLSSLPPPPTEAAPKAGGGTAARPTSARAGEGNGRWACSGHRAATMRQMSAQAGDGGNQLSEAGASRTGDAGTDGAASGRSNGTGAASGAGSGSGATSAGSGRGAAGTSGGSGRGAEDDDHDDDDGDDEASVAKGSRVSGLTSPTAMALARSSSKSGPNQPSGTSAPVGGGRKFRNRPRATSKTICDVNTSRASAALFSKSGGTAIPPRRANVSARPRSPPLRCSNCAAVRRPTRGIGAK